MKDFIDYENKRTTVILPGTNIDGKITAIGDLEIVSDFTGTVYCGQLLRVIGKCSGEIQAQDIICRPGSILKGNIVADRDIVNYSYCEGKIRCLEYETWGQTEGSILCQTLDVYGQENATIISKDRITIHRNGSLNGTVEKAKVIFVESGGKLTGNVTKAKEVYVAAGGIVTGNIYCRSIDVQPGGIVKGFVRLIIENEIEEESVTLTEK